MIYLIAKIFIIFSECSAESMQGYDTSLIYLNWMQVYQLAIWYHTVLSKLCYKMYHNS
jgi:hypothetical protein